MTDDQFIDQMLERVVDGGGLTGKRALMVLRTRQSRSCSPERPCELCRDQMDIERSSFGVTTCSSEPPCEFCRDQLEIAADWRQHQMQLHSFGVATTTLF